jgi:glycosyltransferase involved in cell wall biosynthesis
MYNAERFLALAVDSVCRQTFTDWELVLFDDGSRDGTLEIAQAYASRDTRIRAIVGENGGTARARNRGLAATDATSEFVVFLDNDDVWEPTALQALVQAMEAHPSAPAAHGLARAIDPSGQQFPGDDLAESMARRRAIVDSRAEELPSQSPTTFEALLVENYPVTPGTMLVRREVWNALGGYEPEAVPCDDWDMHLRIARRGGVVLVNQIILNWRRHPGAASHNTSRWRKAYLLVRKRSVLAAENTPPQRRAALTAFQLTCRGAQAEIGWNLRKGQWSAGSRALARWVLYEAAFRQVKRAAAT